MSRSLWKGPFCEIKIKDSQSLKPLNIKSRRSVILPEFVGRTFNIYNGKSYISCKILETMIGLKFGEFSSTRKKPIHKNKTKQKSK